MKDRQHHPTIGLRIAIGGALLLLSVLLRAQQGYIRIYTHDTTYVQLYAVRILDNDDLLLSGELGDWGQRTYNIKVDAFGNEQWRNTTPWIGLTSRWNEVSLGDTLFFQGGRFSLDPQIMSDPYIQCFDNLGNTRWARKYDHFQHESFTNLALSNQGQLYGFGAYQDTSYFYRTFLLRVDLQGNEVWRHNFVDTLNISTQGMVALPSGDILLGILHEMIPHLVLFDSNGTIIWERSYPEFELAFPFSSMRLTSGDRILCKANDGRLREIGLNGDILRTYADGNGVYDAIRTADGGMMILGAIHDGSDFFLRKLAPDWSEEWYQTYYLPETNYVGAIAEAPNGDFIMTGHKGTTAFEPRNGLLIRTDCMGNITSYRECKPPLPTFTLFPNPNNGTATLSIPADAVSTRHVVQVFDALGRQVMQTAAVDVNYLDLDLSLADQGIYFLRVLSGGKTLWHGHWVLQR
jgi:hypothetical protein